MTRYCLHLISSPAAFDALKPCVQKQWFRLAIEDGADAMGCLLMGGEL